MEAVAKYKFMLELKPGADFISAAIFLSVLDVHLPGVVHRTPGTGEMLHATYGANGAPDGGWWFALCLPAESLPQLSNIVNKWGEFNMQRLATEVGTMEAIA